MVLEEGVISPPGSFLCMKGVKGDDQEEEEEFHVQDSTLLQWDRRKRGS
jgi:hypothetical protein